MKAIFAALVLVMTVAGGNAWAVNIHGIDVVDVGTPACVGRNPVLRTNNGEVFNNLTASQQGLANPWAQWPQFLGAPYSALVGTRAAPAVGVLRYATPRTTFRIAWSTPDVGYSSNWIGFYSGHTLIAYINGDDVLAAFGPSSPTLIAVNLSMVLPHPYDAVRLISAEPPGLTGAFEFANLNVTCNFAQSGESR